MNRNTLSRLCVLLLAGLLAACGAASDESDDAAAAATHGQVAVTTARPVQRTFHDTVEAWGSAVGDPHRARAISLPYGGQVTVVKVAPGQTVARGQALLTSAPDPAARNAWQQASNALQLARGELERTEQLAAQRLATQSQLASARKTLADAESALAAQRALGGGNASTTVSAPSDGVVTTLGVGLGDRVAANAPLLGFMPRHALVADLGVQPADGAKLHPGMTVHMQSVYGAAGGFDGTLLMIGQSIDATTHLLPAQADIPAAAGAALVAGEPLQAQIRTADYRAWAVPRGAVLQDGHEHYLFQVEHGKAKRIDVALRHAAGDTVGVDGPLDAQAPVIVLGAYELDDGDAVVEAGKGSSR
jgi:RND family efflux transporter MFP subunit